jgi:hypothetical protein
LVNPFGGRCEEAICGLLLREQTVFLCLFFAR